MRSHDLSLSIFILLLLLAPTAAQQPQQLALTPIAPQPEPLGELHPKLRWMHDEKIRAMWISYNLFDRFGDIEVTAGEGEKTKAAVLKETGFNVVSITMNVNSDGDPDGTTLDLRTIAPKHDRTRSTDIETRLAPNVAAAREYGLTLLVGLKYGSNHLEPYRKYRGADGKLAKRSCCPLDETYIAGPHVGNWAVRAAQLGADGVNIDIEMYHSDASSYPGPCYCDDCFAIYLAAFARDSRRLYDQIRPEDRGRWIAERQGHDYGHGRWGGTHYVAFAARRIEALWDGIRRRCQAINPAFVLAQYHMLEAMPGMERGLGTADVPCLMLSAHEYHSGPYRSSYISKNRIREHLPVLFVSGLYVNVQWPERFAENALRSCLYTDGYFVYYGSALLNFPSPGQEKKAFPGGYGRWGNSSAAEYLNELADAHTHIAELLVAPPDTWPKRIDGKLRMLQERLQTAESEAEANPSAESQRAVEDTRKELGRYRDLLDQGGY